MRQMVDLTLQMAAKIYYKIYHKFVADIRTLFQYQNT